MTYLEQAGRLGHLFAINHPYADAWTALQWAGRLPTMAESRAFMRSWRKAIA